MISTPKRKYFYKDPAKRPVPLKDDNVKLLTMQELAEYCGRTYQVMRLQYSAGVLPEPRFSKLANSKRMRRWTIMEAIQIKAIFENRKYGDFATKSRRAKARKLRMYEPSTSTNIRQ